MNKLQIWDFDGTLVDSQQGCFSSYKFLCESLGIPFEFTFDEFRAWYDIEWHNNFSRLKIPQEQWELANALYKKNICTEKPLLYPGIIEVIKAQHARSLLVVISGGNGTGVRRKLQQQGIRKYFAEVSGYPGNLMKPNPLPFLEVMKRHGATPSETVLVGDMAKDVLTARNAGIGKIISVTYGWQTKEQLLTELKKLKISPHFFANTPKELMKILKDL